MHKRWKTKQQYSPEISKIDGGIKNIVKYLCLSLIIMGFFTGCIGNQNSNTVDYKNLDYNKVEYKLTALYIPSGSPGWGGIDVMLEFTFPDKYFGNPNVMTGCTIKELNYVLSGNTHYAGGQKITSLSSGTSTYGSFRGRIEVFTMNTDVYPYQKIWLIDINPDLKTAMENETPIEWSLSGELSTTSPDDSDTMTIPVSATYYQIDF